LIRNLRDAPESGIGSPTARRAIRYPFLTLLYLGFGVLLASTIPVDFLGLYSGNIGLRVFVPFLLFAAPMAALVIRPVFAKKRWIKTLVVAITISVFLFGAVVKPTNDPAYSNTWTFYSDGEKEAVSWTLQHVPADVRIYGDYDARLNALKLLISSPRDYDRIVFVPFPQGKSRTILRILVTTPYYSPDDKYGGPAIVARHLCDGLAERNHEILVLTGRHLSSSEVKDERVSGHPSVHVIRLPLWVDGGFYLARGLLGRLLNEEFDLIHAHSYRNAFSDSAYLAAKLKRKPFALSCHGTLSTFRHVPTFPHRLKVAYLLHDWMFGAVARRATGLLATSREEIEQYRDFGARGQVMEIPNGVDCQEFSPFPSHYLSDRLGVEGPFVVSAGRLERTKGFEALLKVFSILQRTSPEAKLVVMGEDFGEERHIRILAEDLGIREHTYFLGGLPHNQMPEVYNSSDVVVSTAHYEIFGLSILEAMACARPVVARRVGGIGELITAGENGLFIPSNGHGIEYPRFANLLDDLLTNEEERTRLGQAARLRALENDWRNIVPLVEAYLIGLAG
jgi:glycosyltransferase involved in cell wall biosynthesis